MTDKTIREGGSGSFGGRTVREGAGVGGTVRESAAGATLREGIGPAGQGRGSAWLPGSLANRFEVVEELPTRGSEADLYVVSNADGQRFVAKIYRRGIQPKEEILGILKRADFEHVVQLEEFGEEDGRWWELIEYIEQSSLRVLIDQDGPKLPDATARHVLQELNDALRHLHSLPIEHRDLKPDNVLVRTREPLDLVLADFGIASVMDASVRFTDTARTIRYAPPEAVGTIVPEDRGNLRNMVAIARTRWDYWSLGVILVEMLTGEHPYSGISEAAIGHRLATQNVDDLVEGVEQEGWRKLCRGLLRRDPGKRWGSEQVSLWLENERDSRLTVEDEVAPAEQTVRGIDFDGRSFTTPESLGAALSEDWSKAESFWKRRLQDLQTWIIDTLGQQERGKALDTIDKDQRRKIDAQVFSFVYILAPSAPLRFKGVELSPTNLERVAKRAADGDRSARTTLLSIYENDILTLASALEQGKGLSSIARNWRDTVSDYRSKLQDVERSGARAPALEGDTLVKLLAAALPVPSVVSELRAAAQRATTSDARECPWFRNLGDPDTASVGAIMIMPHVIREAEAGARERRYDAALENFGVPARFLLGSAGGLVGGIVTAFVPGFVVYWPIVWIWGEQSATTIALLWMIGCAIVAGLSKWVDLPRLVGNESRDHSEVRTKGLFYSIAGAAVIAGVLFYSIPEVRSEYQRFAGEEARRVAGLSARVWATSGRNQNAMIRFNNGQDIVMRVNWIGNFVEGDGRSFRIVYPNGSSGTCPGSTCTISQNQGSAYAPGEYRLEARADGRVVASTTFTVGDFRVDGLPVEYMGQANGARYTLRSDRWLSFDWPRNYCHHWRGDTDRLVQQAGPDRSAYLFRARSGTITLEIDTVAKGQTQYGRRCN